MIEHSPARATLALLRRYDEMADFAAIARSRLVTQRDFLLAALYVCKYTRQDLADRLGCSRKGLEKWLAYPDAADYHEMSSIIWKFVAEIMLKHDPSLAPKMRLK